MARPDRLFSSCLPAAAVLILLLAPLCQGVPEEWLRETGSQQGEAVLAQGSDAPPLAYTWNGPVSATKDAGHWAQLHPALSLGLFMEWVYFTVKGIEKHLNGTAPSPAPSPAPAPAPQPTPEFFVQIIDGSFVSGVGEGACQKLFISGSNKFEFVEAAAGVPVLFDGQLFAPGLTGPGVVRETLSTLSQDGFTVLRFNAFAAISWWSVLGKDSSGALTYNEAMLRGLDYALDQARQAGVKIILVLTDYFASGAGGPDQYLSFVDPPPCGAPPCKRDLFFSNTKAMDFYKAFTKKVLTRVNTINGRAYNSDPTVFGIDLMNEPRCQDPAACYTTPGDASTPVVAAWVKEMAAYVRSLDSVHPITVGLDGFYTQGPGTDPSIQPYSTAGTETNADFVLVSRNVDFAEFNVYPDLYNRLDSAWVDSWIAQHASDGVNVLQKPVLIKELGAQPTAQRNQLYTSMYSKASDQVAADKGAVGGLKGASFWQFFAPGTQAVWYTQAPGGRFGIFPSDNTFTDIIQPFTSTMAGLTKDAQITCPAGNAYLEPQIIPVPACPAGFEGPNCDQDIDECARGLDSCSERAACVNTPGSYTCECFTGYMGSGRICLPNLPLLAAISRQYSTQEQYFCGARTPVAYPATSPGWRPDPSGFFDAKRPNHNRVNVTLEECKIACYTAGSACNAFDYNPGLADCLLQAITCPINQCTPGSAGCCNPQATEQCTGQDFTNVPPQEPTDITFDCGTLVTYYRDGAC